MYIIFHNGILEITTSKNIYTGGPRNSRIFYLRIRLFAVGKYVPNLKIRVFLPTLPRLFAIFKQNV